MVLLKSGRLLIISTMLLETLFIVLINQQVYLSENIDDLKVFLPYVNLIILVLSGLTIFSITELEKDARKMAEANILKVHLRQVEDLLKVMRVQKHEHSRHIQTIQAMLYLGEVDKTAEYIEGIADSYRYNEKIVCAGHPALTALLNSKQQVAQVKKIDFAFAIKCDITKLNVPPWDLCSILGNLLDNAFEAALLEHVDRRVAVEIKYEDANYSLYVYNTGLQISAKAKQRLFTAGYTTKGSAARGYGLYLVKRLVDKYEGKVEVISGERTTFMVYFPDRDRGKR